MSIFSAAEDDLSSSGVRQRLSGVSVSVSGAAGACHGYPCFLGADVADPTPGGEHDSHD